MVNSFINYLQFEKRYSPHTISSYQSDLQDFETFLDSEYSIDNLAKVSSGEIRAWIISLSEKDLSERSINRKLATVRSYYKFLLTREVIDVDPTTPIRSLKTQKTLPTFIQEPHMDVLLDDVRRVATDSESFSDLRDQLIVELLYATGMRRAELINLKESDLDLDQGILKILGKRNKERIIPIPKNIVLRLKEYKSAKHEQFGEFNDSHLIVTNKGAKTYPNLIYKIVNTRLRDMKINKKSPHVLRHTAATHLLNNGADINAVKDFLGHANLAATQVYTHNTLDKLKAAFDQAHPKA